MNSYVLGTIWLFVYFYGESDFFRNLQSGECRFLCCNFYKFNLKENIMPMFARTPSIPTDFTRSRSPGLQVYRIDSTDGK